MENLLKSLNLKFKNKNLYELAFVHRSYLNENKDTKEHNERIEFLWDAVLELSITDFLYKKFPDFPEWKLTNFRSSLVKRETLALASKELNFWEYLKLSKWENDSWWRQNDYILANTYEAFLWALYLDLWYKKADEFVLKTIATKIDKIVEKQLFIDPKTKIQSYIQAVFKFTPKYEVISDTWPDHDKNYVVWVYSNWCLMWVWKWSSKQNAQQDAAKNAASWLWI